MAQQQVLVRVLQTAGATDYASEVEANMVGAHIGLFQVQPFRSGSVSRADLELHRISGKRGFYDAISRPGADILHVITHGSNTELQCGLTNISPSDIRGNVTNGALADTTVVSTACHLGAQAWVDLFLNHLGADALIASPRALTFRDTAVFSTSFYNAYLGQIHRGFTQRERGWRAFRIAYGVYRSCITNKDERVKIDYFSLVNPSGKKLVGTIDLP